MNSQQKVHRRLFGLVLLAAITSFIGTGCNKQKEEVKQEYNEAKQEMQEAGRDIKRGAQKATREIKDESCEMVNGKMECAAQKAKHSMQNTSDKVEDAVD